jgi:hypothetical protein
MGLFPKMLGGFQRIDFVSVPPHSLIASLMKLPMMPAAFGSDRLRFAKSGLALGDVTIF